MTNNSQDPYLSIRILKSILKTLWTIIAFATNLIWWTFSKLPKTVSFGLIPVSLIMASGYTAPEPEQKGIIIFDEPTPTEQRLKELEGTTWSRSDIDWYIGVAAEEYGVDPEYIKAIIGCESGFDQYIQSRHIYNFTDAKRGIYNGEKELSIGLSQINLHYHPNVTVEMAQSPKYSIEFLVDKVSKNQAHLWSCSKLI